jgi:hypothetical protein
MAERYETRAGVPGRRETEPGVAGGYDRGGYGDRRNVQVASGLSILLSVWLWVSPWVLIYAGDAGWNSTITAVVIGVLALIRVLGAHEAAWLSWINVALGAWLVVSPWFVSGYTEAARVNSVVVGVVVAALALWSAVASPRPADPGRR